MGKHVGGVREREVSVFFQKSSHLYSKGLLILRVRGGSGGEAWASANLSAGQFVMGVEDNVTSRSLPDFDVVNSTVGGDNKLDFEDRFWELSALGDDHIISVVEDESPGKIIATGSIFMEKKFLRNCGKVGHIEDVVVDSNARGLKLGKKIIAFLTEHARLMGCYKVILDCSLENKAFYEKCGFKQKDIQMIKVTLIMVNHSSTDRASDGTDGQKEGQWMINRRQKGIGGGELYKRGEQSSEGREEPPRTKAEELPLAVNWVHSPSMVKSDICSVASRGPGGPVLKLARGNGAEASMLQGHQQLIVRCGGAGTKRVANAGASGRPPS
nr:glucosamine 6-phosphate n-acetyltransferase [Quercus suber]